MARPLTTPHERSRQLERISRTDAIVVGKAFSQGAFSAREN